MTADVIVTYHAKEQFRRLSEKEQAALKRLLSVPGKPGQTKRMGASGRFVSRLGSDKRVLWKKSNDGNIVVLSVVAA